MPGWLPLLRDGPGERVKGGERQGLEQSFYTPGNCKPLEATTYQDLRSSSAGQPIERNGLTPNGATQIPYSKLGLQLDEQCSHSYRNPFQSSDPTLGTDEHCSNSSSLGNNTDWVSSRRQYPDQGHIRKEQDNGSIQRQAYCNAPNLRSRVSNGAQVSGTMPNQRSDGCLAVGKDLFPASLAYPHTGPFANQQANPQLGFAMNTDPADYLPSYLPYTHSYPLYEHPVANLATPTSQEPYNSNYFPRIHGALPMLYCSSETASNNDPHHNLYPHTAQTNPDGQGSTFLYPTPEADYNTYSKPNGKGIRDSEDCWQGQCRMRVAAEHFQSVNSPGTEEIWDASHDFGEEGRAKWKQEESRERSLHLRNHKELDYDGSDIGGSRELEGTRYYCYTLNFLLTSFDRVLRLPISSSSQATNDSPLPFVTA